MVGPGDIWTGPYLTETVRSLSVTVTTPVHSPPEPRLEMKEGRWITNWTPEDPAFWNGPGRATAPQNLIWTLFCELL